MFGKNVNLIASTDRYAILTYTTLLPTRYFAVDMYCNVVVSDVSTELGQVLLVDWEQRQWYRGTIRNGFLTLELGQQSPSSIIPRVEFKTRWNINLGTWFILRNQSFKMSSPTAGYLIISSTDVISSLLVFRVRNGNINAVYFDDCDIIEIDAIVSDEETDYIIIHHGTVIDVFAVGYGIIGSIESNNRISNAWMQNNPKLLLMTSVDGTLYKCEV